jgi:Zn-finger protein
MGCSKIERPHAEEFLSRMRDLGVNATELWMMPWIDDEGLFGTVSPWLPRSDGKYDLSVVNNEYWDLNCGFIDLAHQRGQVVQLCFFDLYCCSSEKQGMLWVPDRNRHPVRNNVNGVRWGDPNDDEGIYFYLPDDVLSEFIRETFRRLPQTGVYARTANESPERPMHQRLRDVIKSARPGCFVICNRQNNNSGQYRNMVINGGLDGIEFHNFDHVSYIDTPQPPGEVPNTYEKAWAEADPRRIFMSTDGCRNGNTTDVGQSYNYNDIRDVLIDHWQRGFNISHQSDRKMVKFIEGRFHFEQWENELRMLDEVRREIGR